MAEANVNDPAKEDQTWVLDNIGPIFPQYSREEILQVIKKPRDGVYERGVLLNMCIDEVLSHGLPDISVEEIRSDDVIDGPQRVEAVGSPANDSIVIIETPDSAREIHSRRGKKRSGTQDTISPLPKQPCVRLDEYLEASEELPDLVPNEFDSYLENEGFDDIPDEDFMELELPDIDKRSSTEASSTAGPSSANGVPKNKNEAELFLAPVVPVAQIEPTIISVDTPVEINPQRLFPTEPVPERNLATTGNVPDNQVVRIGDIPLPPEENVVIEEIADDSIVIEEMIDETPQDADPPAIADIDVTPVPVAAAEEVIAAAEEVVAAAGEVIAGAEEYVAAAEDVEVLEARAAANTLNDKINIVLALLPDVDPAYVEATLKRYTHNDVEHTCDFLLENKDYPKVKKEKPAEPKKKLEEGSPKDPTNFRPTEEYKRQTTLLLQRTFRRVSVKDLRKLLGFYNYQYTHVHNCLMEAVKSFEVNLTEEANASTPKSRSKMTSSVTPEAQIKVKVSFGKHTETVTVKPLKCGRNPYTLQSIGAMLPQLEKEVEDIRKNLLAENEEKDRHVAELLNESEYQNTGQLIECGCCFGEHPFEAMIQCYEGHLFCADCLKNYAKEAVYGQGKLELNCMSDGCDTNFPKGQLERALPKEMFEKYEERMKEEALNLADIEGLVRCPHCDFAAVLHPDEKVFSCLSCKKETCRNCKEDWEEHFGIPCSELEKKDETKLRLRYEEKMTLAKIRTCPSCKASFTKSDGCNKMTCRCGAKMCYICRQMKIDYNHFCRHARDPGENCKTCKSCSLWSNPEEDDERAVEELKKEAVEEAKAKGFTDKAVGAPEDEADRKKRQQREDEKARIQQRQDQLQNARLANQQQHPRHENRDRRRNHRDNRHNHHDHRHNHQGHHLNHHNMVHHNMGQHIQPNQGYPFPNPAFEQMNVNLNANLARLQNNLNMLHNPQQQYDPRYGPY